MRWGAYSLLRRRSTALLAHQRLPTVVAAALLALAAAPFAEARLDRSEAPSVTYTLSGTAGDNGWFRSDVSIHWVVEPTQGLINTTGCEPAVLVPGDTGGATRTCRAEWSDGTTIIRTTSPAIKIDETAPTDVAGAPGRVPDSNGWYNDAVTVRFSGTDAMSGIASCTSTTYDSPDGADKSIPGSCRDNAGNVTASNFAIDFDATAPGLAAKTPERSPDKNGWYNHEVRVDYTGIDATSGISSCDSPTYGFPDSSTASVTGRCRDRAANASPSSSFALKYDETGPAVTTTADRGPNGNGWYREKVTISFAATDGISGVAGCPSPIAYSSPDSGAASVSGTCSDNAGNTTTRAHALKYDGTAPAATPVPRRNPNANGWYNAAVTVDYHGTDGTSGVDTCSTPSYSGPDDDTASVSGTCTDKAGNVSPAVAFAIKYDETDPVVTTSADRAPNGNGWYTAPVTVSFAATDDTSGVAACPSPVRYSTPDSAGASVSGSCTDKAGNSASRAHAFKYDQTAPSVTSSAGRPPNANGWYRADVTITFAATDTTSGPATCPAPVTYSGPDDANASVTKACSDGAGNSTARVHPLKYDETAPTVNGAAAARGPDLNGWYNEPVGFTFAGADETSTVEACPGVTYSGPDGEAASVRGTCRDKAGNTGVKDFPLRYDNTAPVVRATPRRGADSNGWYNQAITVSFTGTDAPSGVGSCTGPETYEGPNDADASVSGTCTDVAGNTSAAKAFGLSYDGTAPTVGPGQPDRLPDVNGWYNHAVTVSFPEVSDALSGAAPCPSRTYAGPAKANAVVVGRCPDQAGNVGTSPAFELDYDATGPSVQASFGRPPDRYGWYGHDVRIGFRATDATSGTAGCSPSVVYQGPNSERASVSGSCTDRAGNRRARAFVFKYSEPLLLPRAGRHFTRPPLLDWVAVPRAGFYNAQLWRGGVKILSVFPRLSQYQLRRSWIYQGRRYWFSNGRYTWYVWPHLPGRYGIMLGKSFFYRGG
jgi:large repetitive protein